MKRWIGCLLMGVLFSFLVVSPGVAQTTFGSITGTVIDPNGSAVPGAKVIATSEGEGSVRQVNTEASGIFNVSNLNVGTYRLQVSVSGFAPYEATGLILSANQILNVNIHLAVAHAAASVVHVHGVTAISTETTNISNVTTARVLTQLPAISRQKADQGIASYELLNPGTSSTSGNSEVNVPGVLQMSVVPTMDGIAVTANESNIGGGPIQPGQDAIQEMNFQLANTPAEFSTPANIAVVTKSGTNEFHGAAFWTYNGNSLNARNYFSSKVPFRVYNDFGASLGGPIRKDKTFFFGDYEGSREASNVVVTGNTALPAWRTGDFSGVSKPVIDPTTGKPFFNNMIPSYRISPVSQKVQDFFYPFPNFGPPGLQSGNWRGQFPAQTGFTHFDNFDVRVDQNFRNGDKVFTRFSYRRMPLTAHENTLPPVGQRIQLRTAESAVVSWTHLFSPAVLNEARYGFTRQRNAYHTTLIGSDIIKQVGIQGVSTVGIFAVPAFTITGLTTTDQPNTNNLSLDTDFEWTDNLSWNRGRHSMKFGIDVIRDQIGGQTFSNTIYGSYSFTGIYTGDAYADFLLGIPQTTSLVVPTPARHLRGTLWSLYAQDQFKVNPRITANYGLRWEYDAPYYDRYGTNANFDPATDGWVVPDVGLAHINPLYPTNIPIIAASKVGYPKNGLVDSRKLNFYPRIGIAIKPFNNDKTVVRAAYGIYGNPIYGGAGRALGGGPFAGSVSYFNAINNGVPLFSFPEPFLTSGKIASQTAFGINPRLRTPYTQQWNLTVERQLGTAAVRLSYVGSHSVNLVYARNLNQPEPSTTPFSPSRYFYQNFTTITWYDNGADEEYNGLQASIAKHFGANLTFNVGWTWSRDLTDAQNTGGSFYGGPIQNQFNLAAEYGPNEITPTHRVYGYVVYQLPFGTGQRFLDTNSRVAQTLLGGWQMAWNGVVQSGQFFDPSYSGFDSSNTNTLGGRPDVVPGVSPRAVGTQSITNWFNPAAFKIPGCPNNDTVCAHPANVGRFGTLGVGTLRGPAIYNADLALSKFFTLYDNIRLQFQANTVDVFNHPDFALPAANISSPGTVAQITSQIAPSLGSNAGRQLDFMLRLQF